MELKTIEIKAPVGMWLYDGVSEPCKQVSVAVGADATSYHKITEAEYQEIKSEEERLSRYRNLDDV